MSLYWGFQAVQLPEGVMCGMQCGRWPCQLSPEGSLDWGDSVGWWGVWSGFNFSRGVHVHVVCILQDEVCRPMLWGTFTCTVRGTWCAILVVLIQNQGIKTKRPLKSCLKISHDTHSNSHGALCFCCGALPIQIYIFIILWPFTSKV